MNRVWFGPADQTMKNALNAVSRWTNTNVVEMPARSLILDIIMAETPHDNVAIEGALEESLPWPRRPVPHGMRLPSSQSSRSADGERAFRVPDVLLTGSHEGYFMMERAIFGLNYWNELPEKDRRIVVRDLLGSFGHSPVMPSIRYRKTLAAKSQAERENIKAALLASGRASKDILQALGV